MSLHIQIHFPNLPKTLGMLSWTGKQPHKTCTFFAQLLYLSAMSLNSVLSWLRDFFKLPEKL